jgi:hypothetical protein
MPHRALGYIDRGRRTEKRGARSEERARCSRDPNDGQATSPGAPRPRMHLPRTEQPRKPQATAIDPSEKRGARSEKRETRNEKREPSGYTRQDMARRVGKSRSAITESLSLNNLPEQV